MDDDNPIFISGYRPTPVNYSECKKDSPRFWQYIRSEISAEEISVYDLSALNILCSNLNWMDLLPKGLVSSYSYLYHCVKGLGCEDAEAIEKDVLRTVGAVKDGPKVFSDISENGKAGLARSMHRVLTAISIIDSMGYCQGMNYIVDFLLKMKSEEEAFSLFLYALRNKHLCSLYETKLPVLSEFMEIFELHLAHRHPFLSNHLKERGFIAPFYSIEWFTTLFTLASPFDLTVAVWDMFFAGIQDAQLRCGLAMMEVLEPLLLKMTTEELLKEFRYLCQTVTRDEVILRALRIQLSPVRVGYESNNVRLIDPKYKDERFTDTLLWLRAQYLNEAKTAMQERDIDNARWVKQRKYEKYEKRKQKYLQKRKHNSAKDLMPISDETRRRNQSSESDTLQQMGSDQERSSYQSSTRETLYHRKIGDETPESLCSPQSRSKSSPEPPLNDFDGDAPTSPYPTPLSSTRMNSCLSSEADPIKYQDSDDDNNNNNEGADNEEDLDQDQDEEDDQDLEINENGDDDDEPEDIAASYEVYFDFFVSPTLLQYANLLKKIVLKCDRITSWNLLNQLWLETLPHIKNTLAKYNFADYMLRYSIKSNAHLRVIEFFLCVGGSDPNSQDRWLRTPLHYAVVYNRPDILRFLLLIGADSTIPGAICITNSLPASWNSSSSLVNYNLYTPRELLLNLNISSSSPSLMLLKERCCLWCQKLFHSPDKNSSNHPANSSQSFARAYCGLCAIPFCIQCIQYHKCVYSIDKYEYHNYYLQHYLDDANEIKRECSTSRSHQSEQEIGLKSSNSDCDGGVADVGGVGGGGEELQALHHNDSTTSPAVDPEIHDVLLDALVVQIDHQSSESELHERDNLQQYSVETTLDHIPEELDNLISDDQSEMFNGRDSLDSGFGSADEVKMISPGRQQLEDNIEEFYDSDDDDEHDQEKENEVSDSDDNEEVEPSRPFERMSLAMPFKKFLGRNRNVKASGKDETIIVSEVADLTSQSQTSHLSSSPKTGTGLTLPWRRGSQPHIEVDTGSSSVPSQESGKGVFSRSRTLSIDLSILTGDKKEKKSKLFDSSHPSPFTNHNSQQSNDSPFPPPEKKKKIGMLSIGDSLKKFTKGMTKSSVETQPVESITSYYSNDEPVSKFTADGIPYYWVGYQETQFITLQPWQILLLPIVFQTEKYYDSALVPPLSPYQIISPTHNGQVISSLSPPPPPSAAASVPPTAAVDSSGRSKSIEYQNSTHENHSNSNLPSPRNIPPHPHSHSHTHSHPHEQTHSFDDFNAELEQNQPRYLYFKYDITIYYSLLMKDAELFTVDLSPESRSAHDRIAIEPQDGSLELSNTKQIDSQVQDSENMSSSPLPSSTIATTPASYLASSSSAPPTQPSSVQSTDDMTNEIFSKHIKKLKLLQSSSWSLHEGDSQWAPNDCAWYCRTCYSHFSLFQRKHHCRRCGEVFCDDHAPKVDIISCVPKEFRDVILCIPSSDLPDKKQLRICLSCQHEMRECKAMAVEYKSLAPMYTFEFWLETLSKSSLKSSSLLIHNKQNHDNQNERNQPHDGDCESDLKGSIQSNDNSDENNKTFKTTEVGLWMDTMADWIWRDRHPSTNNKIGTL